MTDDVLGYGLAGVSLLFFTTAIVTTKAASNHMPLAIGFLIATVVNAGFAALAYLGQRMVWPATPVNWQALALFALSGVFSTYLGRWFFYESVVRFGPAKASVFQVSSPLFTACMALIFLGEKLSVVLALGMLMTVAGLMLVSYQPNVVSAVPAPKIKPSRRLRQRLLQSVLLLGLCSSMAYAVGNVLRGAAVRQWSEPILGALLGAVVGLVLHLALSKDKSTMVSRLRTSSKRGVWLFILIGVCTISGQISTISAMRFIPVSIATLVTLCTPLLVIPLSRVVYKNQERLSAIALLGASLTLLGMAIIVTR
jgi:drug/metabolite transporter (DMT)-like permease